MSRRALVTGVYAGAAAFSTAVGIVVPELWGLSLPGLALFFWILSSRVERWSGALLSGIIFGVITGCAGTLWFWDTLPLNFLGILDPTTQKIAVGMTWLYVGSSLALSVPVGAVAIFHARGSTLFPLIAGLVWALTEYLRMWGFALTTWGPKSLLGPHFSSAAVGYTFAENPHLLQLAAPFGLDGLNFAVAFSAALLAWLSRAGSQPKGRLKVVVQVALVAMVFWLYPRERIVEGSPSSHRSLRFAVISGNLDTVREHETHEMLIEELSTAVAAAPPADVILLPEEFSLTSIFWSAGDYQQFKERYLGGRDVLIMNSRNNLFPEDERNEAPESKKLVYDSTHSGEIGRYIKQMLMPLGEYAPAFTKTFFSVIPDPELHTYLDDVMLIDPEYTTNLAVGTYRGVRIGGLLCSDLFSPYLYRSLVKDHGAEVLVNLANHFWFHGSRTLYSKMVQMARVHAVWNRRTLLIANNISPSLIINPMGETLHESRWGTRGVMYLTLGF
jgi:apolipoprotein N-acyltransferase